MSVDNLEQLEQKTHYQDLLDEARHARLVRLVSGPRAGLLERLQHFLTNIGELLQPQPVLASVECVRNPEQC